jgi:hypothetical protein
MPQRQAAICGGIWTGSLVMRRSTVRFRQAARHKERPRDQALSQGHGAFFVISPKIKGVRQGVLGLSWPSPPLPRVAAENASDVAAKARSKRP